ncbi:TetR/AcrR family transcriptional regulator [Kribbella catacumbae]|uniref:TetR/AcrR family transcriptional regulator n=1 Tax=Kribbella catacumbae TaxID=460086 RepID=UPI00035EDF37|nr:TetR/AcrR family transcriptional regulator [Kribbella catacumbae]
MTDTVESGSRSRTRRAILDAAVVVFSQRRTASLGDVAAEAGVARSTLHRYFADRAELVHALAADVLVAVEKTIDDSALDQGTPREALHRLAAGYFELGPRIFFLYNEPSFNAPEPDERVKGFFQKLEASGKPIEALIERGHREGVFATSLSADWIIRMFWWMVYIGWEAVDEGALPRLSAPATILQTIEHGILAPGSSS